MRPGGPPMILLVPHFAYYFHVLQVQTKQATESDYEYDSYDS